MAQRLDYQAHAQAGMKALGGVHHDVATSGLPKPLVDLIYLSASQINAYNRIAISFRQGPSEPASSQPVLPAVATAV